MKPPPNITVIWRALATDDCGWDAMRCLYAYVAPNKHEILYIGKAWGVTVRGRWIRAAKEHFWDDLENKREIFKHRVFYGEILLNYRGRLSSELLADVESLLISHEHPWGNIQSRNSRICRPGLVVECVGQWAGRRSIYLDE